MNDNASLPKAGLGIVIPVFNESATLSTLHERLTAVLNSLDSNWQVVYVNDGSTDDSREQLSNIASGEPRVSIIELSRNYGKDAAMTAGLDLVSAEAVVVMDADLQHPPETIRQFVEKWRAGDDVVVAKRKNRSADESWRRVGTKVFYHLLRGNADFDIPEDVGDFRLMSYRAVEALRRLRENHRFMKGLFSWIGFEPSVVEYECPDRLSGHSKWSARALWNYALEGLISFSIRPLRVASIVGAITAFLSLIYGFWIAFRTLLFGDPVPGYPSLMVVILFLGGLQLLALGIIGEYVGRTFGESKRRPVYVIKAVTNRENLLDLS